MLGKRRISDGTFQVIPIYQCNDENRLFREMEERELTSILKPKT